MYWWYLTKRILAIIPTLLTLSVLIFVLKSYLPDGIVDRYLNEALLKNSSIEQREIKGLVREIKADLGLDKPIFYFSIRSNVLPDTLNQMYPSGKAVFLEQLLLEYGNPDLVRNYYLLLEEESASNDPERSKVIGSLYSRVDASEVLSFLNDSRIDKNDPIRSAFDSMHRGKSYWRPIIPSLTWNGMTNQFHEWVKSVLLLDFGRSIVDNKAVSYKVERSLINTLWITLPAFLLLLVAGILMGVTIYQSNPKLRKYQSTVLYALHAMPTFWLSLILIYLFAGQALFNIFPAYGMGAFREGANIISRIPFLVLPVSALFLTAIGYIALQVAKALTDEEDKLYITSLRARGLDQTQILWRHQLKNSLVPIITIYSEYLTAVFAGSLVVEVIFSIPGMGKLLYDSVLARDYNVVIGLVIFIALIKLIANLLADISYKLVNPSVDY